MIKIVGYMAYDNSSVEMIASQAGHFKNSAVCFSDLYTPQFVIIVRKVYYLIQ